MMMLSPSSKLDCLQELDLLGYCSHQVWQAAGHLGALYPHLLEIYGIWFVWICLPVL